MVNPNFSMAGYKIRHWKNFVVDKNFYINFKKV
jgi:hypothetical protein